MNCILRIPLFLSVYQCVILCKNRVCKFLGDISYPLYMVHYPFIYLYYAWVKNENLTFTESLPGALALVAGSVILAYLCLKLYDEPVRRFLTDRFLRREK